MSGFFGIFRSEGGQIDMDQFERMKSAMQREGYDGMEIHVEENIAVGHLMLRVGNASEFDKQPLKSDCGNYLLVGHFRLDYRDELGDKLGLTQSELESTPDSKLVLISYIKWGNNAFKILEGDFAFLLYLKGEKKVIIHRSKTGISALFYFSLQGNYFFSSDSSLITKVFKSSVKVNESIVRSALLLKRKYSLTDTFISNLYNLPCGELISIDKTKGLNKKSYFNFSITQKDSYRYIDDCIHDLHLVYACATKSRLIRNKENAIFLSGGKDSTSVGYYLSKSLLKDSKYLHSFTSIPAFPEIELCIQDNIVNEREYVDEYVSQSENIKNNFLNFENISHLNIFKRVLENPYSPFLTRNSFWIHGILDELRKSGMRNAFVGQLGNWTISYNGYYEYLHLLKSFQFKSLFSQLHTQIQINKSSVFKIIKRQILLPMWNWTRVSYSSSKDYQLKKDRLSLFGNKFILKLFVSIDILLMFLRNLFTDIHKLRVNKIKEIANVSGVKWYTDALDYAVLINDPTSDSRLIDFLLGIDQTIFFRFGRPKYLFYILMSKKLPVSILANEKYMHQAFDYEMRVKADSLFKNFLLKEAGKIEVLTDYVKELKGSFEEFDSVLKNLEPYIGKKILDDIIFKISLSYFCNSYK